MQQRFHFHLILCCSVFSLNADPLTNPYSPKPKKEEELAPGSDYYQP